MPQHKTTENQPDSAPCVVTDRVETANEESSHDDTNMDIDVSSIRVSQQAFKPVAVDDIHVDKKEKTLQFLRDKMERLKAKIIKVGSTFAMTAIEEEMAMNVLKTTESATAGDNTGPTTPLPPHFPNGSNLPLLQ
ncbi:hypothetical protein BGW41_002304 [Actinomortierella wolfii]|nr:hypothetical protein BGW41_002304 [Actinomortierella wolfii]